MISRLLENLEIDWQHLCGPATNRDGELSKSSGEDVGPTLQSFTSEDLGSVASLLVLHRESVARGLVPNSEHALLAFLATAQSCLRRGRNSAAFFRWLIEAGLWNEATLEDEDIAHAAFKRYLRARYPSFLKMISDHPPQPRTFRP